MDSNESNPTCSSLVGQFRFVCNSLTGPVELPLEFELNLVWEEALPNPGIECPVWSTANALDDYNQWNSSILLRFPCVIDKRALACCLTCLACKLKTVWSLKFRCIDRWSSKETIRLTLYIRNSSVETPQWRLNGDSMETLQCFQWDVRWTLPVWNSRLRKSDGLRFEQQQPKLWHTIGIPTMIVFPKFRMCARSHWALVSVVQRCLISGRHLFESNSVNFDHFESHFVMFIWERHEFTGSSCWMFHHEFRGYSFSLIIYKTYFRNLALA